MSSYKFIVFEGIDGSGKSTQSKLLQSYLQEKGIPFHGTFEPTNNFIGAQIRNILTGKQAGHPITVANLFAADRYDHLTHEAYGLIPLLQNQHVVCDRYLLSSYAYQGLDAPVSWIKEINKYNEALLWPDVIFYIKLTPDQALARIKANRAQIDLFETEEKLTQIFHNYEQAIASLDEVKKKSMVIIDGTKSIEEIQQEIQQYFESII